MVFILSSYYQTQFSVHLPTRRIHMAPRRLLLIFLCLAYLLHSVVGDDSVNLSSITWATTTSSDHDPASLVTDNVVQNDELGFNSLDSMLQWAIGHSDPDTLKGAAQEVRNLSPAELEARQATIRELVESLRMPSDADLMKIAIGDLQNSSSLFIQRKRALQELLELVEPIDNANDLHKLGGLTIVVEELGRPEEDLRVLAAWILGKASQNNQLVQDQVPSLWQALDVALFDNLEPFLWQSFDLLELGVLPTLMQMTQTDSSEEAVKALYAVSAIIRNHPAAQQAFCVEGGTVLLENLMKNVSADVRLHRKSLFVVADLAEQQKESDGALTECNPSRNYALSVVNLALAKDLDTQEKALMAIQSLSYSSKAMYDMLKHECDVVSALRKVNLQLDELMKADNQVVYVEDLQTLCQSLLSTFSIDFRELRYYGQVNLKNNRAEGLLQNVDKKD